MQWNYWSILNFSDVTNEVVEWISNFIAHVTGYVITSYPCWDLS